mmetsp:Transcript_40202/g.87647  ORF Transcript_40202/g.87647 Transcript_40202/m.87647 type:complete len:341 (-) Transcript_40202:10-1032(-)
MPAHTQRPRVSLLHSALVLLNLSSCLCDKQRQRLGGAPATGSKVHVVVAEVRLRQRGEADLDHGRAPLLVGLPDSHPEGLQRGAVSHDHPAGLQVELHLVDGARHVAAPSAQVVFDVANLALAEEPALVRAARRHSEHLAPEAEEPELLPLHHGGDAGLLLDVRQGLGVGGAGDAPLRAGDRVRRSLGRVARKPAGDPRRRDRLARGSSPRGGGGGARPAPQRPHRRGLPGGVAPGGAAAQDQGAEPQHPGRLGPLPVHLLLEELLPVARVRHVVAVHGRLAPEEARRLVPHRGALLLLRVLNDPLLLGAGILEGSEGRGIHCSLAQQAPHGSPHPSPAT